MLVTRKNLIFRCLCHFVRKKTKQKNTHKEINRLGGCYAVHNIIYK